jgi:hypothetical protein
MKEPFSPPIDLTEHAPNCSQPGMLWQESIGDLPRRGVCPVCGCIGIFRGQQTQRPAR